MYVIICVILSVNFKKFCLHSNNETFLILYLCERIITASERFENAKKMLDRDNPILLDIIKRNQNVFMADKWDIGCTK